VFLRAASVVLLGITTYSPSRSRPAASPGLWRCLHGWDLVARPDLLPGRELEMLDPASHPGRAAELTAWYRWNWLRTGLGLVSAALACIALTAGRGENATTRGDARSADARSAPQHGATTLANAG